MRGAVTIAVDTTDAKAKTLRAPEDARVPAGFYFTVSQLRAGGEKDSVIFRNVRAEREALDGWVVRLCEAYAASDCELRELAAAVARLRDFDAKWPEGTER